MRSDGGMYLLCSRQCHFTLLHNLRSTRLVATTFVSGTWR